jgi:methyl-accepting chemotaxis protein
MSLDLEILENSFDLIAPRGEELVDVFYDRLFAAAPAVAPLFASSDLGKQKTKLLATLVLLRKSLRDLESITPKLRQLGAKHVAYGAEPEHYPVVAEVMLASMAEIAGAAWTPETAMAWGRALNLVAAAMLEGASDAKSALAAAKPARRKPSRVSRTAATRLATAVWLV